jgi:hydrogenase nickel incorporation protein HypA/HybF
MHELHLMGQVVRAVEQALRKTETGKPSVVRLRVSALSHLLSHDLSSLQSAFEMASLGTTAEGATLDIVTVPVSASCRCCGMISHICLADAACEACGARDVDLATVPEVVVQEVVVTE